MADKVDDLIKELRPDVLLKELVPPPPSPAEVFKNIFNPERK